MLENELRREFLPRFLVAARRRLEDARTASFSRLAGELHSLAGEAMLLGLPEISALASEAEGVARRSFENADAAARASCARSLSRLVEMVEELSAQSQPSSSAVATVAVPAKHPMK